MKYMLMMHVPFGTGEYRWDGWSPDEVQANIRYMHALNRDLRESGEWVDGRGLCPPGEARLVRAGRDGVPVTDGPFPESKEFLAGFWMVEVDSPGRAHELAARVSRSPGIGGAPLHLGVEVRQVTSGPTPEEV
jgi:hypothetical protein